MQKQVGRLPPHSAILYVSMFVDAAGVPYDTDRAIKALRATANAPMTGFAEQGLGLGFVGGPLVDLRTTGEETARVAIRILNGEPPGGIHVPPATAGTPVYDWRELRRWNISEDHLPPGSVIKFRERTVWSRYRNWIIAGVSVFVLEGVLIGALVANQVRRRKAERSLRESEERMKLAADAGDLRLWEWDAVTDRVWVGGPLVERIGPQSTGPVHFSELFQSVHPDDRNGVDLALEKCLKGDGQFENVHRRKLADGKVIWIDVRGRVEFDHARKPLRMRGVSMDVTTRKEAEERARESEGKFLVMANSTPVIMWATGLDKLCTFCNQAWLDFTGRPLERQLGTGWAESLHPEDRTGCIKTYSQAFDARQPFTQEYRVRRHDGQYRWLSDHGVPRYDAQQNFLGFIGSCVDVTEKKEAEAEAQRSREELAHVSRVSTLGELTASLAHELNQPLTAILTNAAAARFLMNGKHRNDEGVCDALTEITGEGQRAGEIIAGMRSMLRKDPGQMVTQDVNVAVSEVLEMVHSDLVSRHVMPVMRLDPLLPPVKARGVQLRQVLLNLVMNACDAMSNGNGGQRQLTIETRRSSGQEVEILVADNGPGFPEEILPHLFEPFHTTKPKGLGLGLAICRSIIAAHGGRLVAGNENGRGAMLRLTLPAQNENGV
jgi:PAS domain S-box-containing protein